MVFCPFRSKSGMPDGHRQASRVTALDGGEDARKTEGVETLDKVAPIVCDALPVLPANDPYRSLLGARAR